MIDLSVVVWIDRGWSSFDVANKTAESVESCTLAQATNRAEAYETRLEALKALRLRLIEGGLREYETRLSVVRKVEAEIAAEKAAVQRGGA